MENKTLLKIQTTIGILAILLGLFNSIDIPDLFNFHINTDGIIILFLIFFGLFLIINSKLNAKNQKTLEFYHTLKCVVCFGLSGGFWMLKMLTPY